MQNENEKNLVKTIQPSQPSLNELLGDTWLAELLAQEPTSHDIDSELEPGEKILGDMTTIERRIYAHSTKLAALAEIAKVQGQFAHDETLVDEARILLHRAVTLAKLMWSLIHDRLGYGGDGLGLRSGFKIVELAKSSEPDLMSMIKDMMR